MAADETSSSQKKGVRPVNIAIFPYEPFMSIDKKFNQIGGLLVESIENIFEMLPQYTLRFRYFPAARAYSEFKNKKVDCILDTDIQTISSGAPHRSYSILKISAYFFARKNLVAKCGNDPKYECLKGRPAAYLRGSIQEQSFISPLTNKMLKTSNAEQILTLISIGHADFGITEYLFSLLIMKEKNIANLDAVKPAIGTYFVGLHCREEEKRLNEDLQKAHCKYLESAENKKTLTEYFKEIGIKNPDLFFKNWAYRPEQANCPKTSQHKIELTPGRKK